MTHASLEWRSYKYFPYEREFARLEVRRLFGVDASETPAGLQIPAQAFRAEAAERLTYFARVIHPNGEVVVPKQAQLEATAYVGGRERQSTRYSAHGLHEYKGKFNPQVVRAIGNILELPQGSSILDPFSGSGTTLLECAHSGWNAFGVDRNPLAVQIANAKVCAIRQDIGVIEEWGRTIQSQLAPVGDALSDNDELRPGVVEEQLGEGWRAEIPAWEYLSSWFTVPVLAQVVAIRRAICASVPAPAARSIFEVVLSDMLRDVSLQEPGDLRIRRRKSPLANYPVVKTYREALSIRLARIARAQESIGEVRGEQRAVLGDIQHLDLPIGRFDAVITSPPYETALPYIDTQRLSLVLFGHIGAKEIPSTEAALIGAREISTRERREIEAIIVSGDSRLPTSVVDLCRELLRAAGDPTNGFRRRNRPALMLRYFMSMSAFFTNIRSALRPGAKLALVVGRNKTVLGGREFEIDTPRLLVDVAVQCGYVSVEEHSMNTYPRYDVHQRNSIDVETLIVLEAP
jgi:site-specific DNA-methyltransferase (cytosine-N4-specific)